MNPEKLQQAIELYDRFTHEDWRDPECSGGAFDPPMDRRDFFARMTLIAGSAAAASSLIASIAASPAAAAIVPEDDKRLRTANVEVALPGIPAYRAYSAEPVTPGRRSSVVVVHENRGLNAHTRDVTRRMALAGFHAIAPDFLSPTGGTPANEDAAREAIGKLDLAESTAHAIRHLEALGARKGGTGKVGAVGFCWGGGFVNRLAVAAGSALDAGVVYYGPAPNPSEAVRVEAPLMFHLAGLDERVAQTAYPWITALRAAGKKVIYFNYEGVNHAFNNDTSAERYNKAAADLAWERTVRFFRQSLA